MFRLIFILAVLFFGCKAQNTSDTSPKDVIAPVKETHVNRNLIIYYDAETGDEALLQSVNDFGAELIYEYRTLKGIAIHIPEGKSMEEAEIYFSKVEGVLSVHRDEIRYTNPPVK